MTRRTPIKKTFVREKVKTPIKERKWTPIEDYSRSPTRESKKNQKKKMCLSIIWGTHLKWDYFLRAQPDIYEELREWMVKTWGSPHPTQGEDSA